MTIALLIIIIILWTCGAIFVSIITGWELTNTKELIKIIFWPVSIFVTKN